MLIAARNPCPCGFYGDTRARRASAPRRSVTRYQKRLSGPLLDRIDLHLSVPRVDFEKLSGQELGERSQRDPRASDRRPRAPVAALHRVDGHAATPRCAWSTRAPPAPWTSRQRPGPHRRRPPRPLARAYHRVLRVGRTIADLAGCDQIQPQHLAEAINYQPRNLNGGFASDR